MSPPGYVPVVSSPLTIRIAGLGITLEGPPEETRAMHEQWSGFFAEPDGSEILVQCEQQAGEVDEGALFATPTVRAEGERWIVAQGNLFELQLDARKKRGRLKWRRAAQDAVLREGPVGIRGALAPLWACLLPQGSGLLIHASGVVRPGGAVVLAGPSGVGKSTVAGHFEPGDVLSDELVAVTLDDRGPLAHATPFSGTLNTPRQRRQANLAGLCFLEQASTTALTPLPAPEGLGRLMACVALPRGAPALEKRAFELGSSVGEGLRIATLEFPRDCQGVAAAMDGWIEAAGSS